ncbi:MAG: Rossmann-like and DUF2520 domain-containing protein [Bacteroidota bacterium]|nr:Rossmann-like and DUF2520 domain-containing protein [Bacteroidota bacterium]
MKDLKIVIIGAGNVAHHLCKELVSEGLSPIYIHSRTMKSAGNLGEEYNIDAGNQIRNIPKADMYIFSLSDTALEGIIHNRELKHIVANALCVHTAGSVPGDLLENLSSNYGVLYPLQTFSKHVALDFSNIPICIEAVNPKNLRQIMFVAELLSRDVRVLNSKQRKTVHTAAVFASNFSNYMYSVSEELLTDESLNFNILHPLILETARKATGQSPSDSQTGPAIRGDEKTMKSHLDVMKNNLKLRKIYIFVSDLIKKQYQNG